MFAAVQNDAFRDGVFSHLDTRGEGRGYQSSVSQFNEGSLGAFTRLAPGRHSNAVQRRSMRGFGHSFRDGSLGADAAPTQVIIGPNGASIGAVLQAPRGAGLRGAGRDGRLLSVQKEVSLRKPKRRCRRDKRCALCDCHRGKCYIP